MPGRPGILRALLARVLGPGVVGRSLLGDLDEEFADRAAADPRAARRWYRREAAGVMWRARRIRTGDAGRSWRTHQPKGKGDPMLQVLWNDVKGAVRTLRKEPRFTIVASITLALGVGAVVSIFSVVNGVLLKPLPHPNPDRLVNVWSNATGLGYNQFPLSPDLYYFYARHQQVFDELAMFQRGRVNLTDTGTPEVIASVATTANYFPTLGVRMVMGRGYRDEEDRPDAPRVAVVSHRFWTNRLAGDSAVLGRQIRLDGQPTEIIGVAPAWLDEDDSAEVFVPTRIDPDQPPAGSFGWNAVGRLRDGVSAGEAAAGLVPLVDRFKEEVAVSGNYRAFLTKGEYRPVVNLLKEDVVGSVREPLWILLGTVGMVLLIACANVANLFLVRADGRQRELAVRSALGASRSSLVRRVLTEALVLASLGTTLGVAVSAAALPALLRLAPGIIPRLDQVSIDVAVVFVAVVAAVLSAMVFGLAPALRYTNASALGALRHGGRGGTDDPARRRGRNLLVVGQTALALILLVGSGLLVRSFANLMATELGFEPDRVLTFRVALPDAAYPESADILGFDERLRTALAAVPGVASVSAVTVLPLAAGAPGTAHEFEGQPIAAGQLPPMVHFKTVAPAYFETMGIALLQGRDFHAGDTRDGVRHVIVNRALADLYWPGENPLGRRVRLGASGAPQPMPWSTVVGLVGTERQDGLRLPPRPLIYYGFNETANNGTPRQLSYVAKGLGPSVSGEGVRQAVWSVDASMPITSMQTMDEIVDGSVVQFTFTMLTLGIAAGLALALGAIGLYGVLSYTVALRTREIGVRLALGAQPSRVMRSVVLSGAAITAVGLAIGLAGAFGLTRFLTGILYETEPLDPATFAGMTLALFVVALVASLLPARRAAAVSPLESMRTE
ncbi:MAG TPA: ABC transporter permease [Vicinamibacterales bacterium]|nr:ABC transporter permease [Vicinamibacterales bacterium]